MPKKLCCCETDICDPFLKDQFVTIFGNLLDSAVPVSSGDLISLKLNRPTSRTKSFELSKKTPQIGDIFCPGCCTECAKDACDDCPKVFECQDSGCGAGSNPAISGASQISDYGQPCKSCCQEICPGTSNITGGFNDKRQNSNVNLDNSPFNVSRIFKKLFNRGTQDPINYGTSYNIKTVEELIADITIKNTKQPTEKLTSVEANTLKTYPSSNQLFKNKLDTLYPVCKQCLIDNGYDIDCIRNGSIDCQNAKIDFCTSCQKECQVYCSGYYGDTPNQHNNIKQLFGQSIYTKNYNLAKGTTFDNPDLYNGNLLINGNGLVKAIDPMETTLDQSRRLSNGGAELNSFLGPLPEVSDTVPADPYVFGGGGSVPNNINQSSTFECAVCPENGGSPASAPLYFIYRYTGCHMVWYPPEYIFNYQTKIAQGSAWKKIGGTSSGLKTCDFLLSGSGYQEDGSDSTGNIDLSCIGNYFFGSCPGSDCTCRGRESYPCQCMRYPHLSGGFVDTARKSFNVSQKIQQGGYLPSQDPFIPPMTVTEAGCCSCANTKATDSAACSPAFDAVRKKRASWPKANSLGKSYPTLGLYCNVGASSDLADTPLFNPNYNKVCFERGISPYLSRISIKLYPAARDIFHYGSVLPKEQEVLGPVYLPTLIQPNQYGWNNASFKKIFNKKSLLYNKLVGLIGLDHHFECWAYHSKSLFAPAPPIAMNHCNALVTPYERPYAGVWKENNFTYDPREAFRYQAMRSIPRRVIYGSSTVPLFHSDLHAMEQISIAKNVFVNGKAFSGEDFIEKFYLMFYNMATDPGDTIYAEPAVEQDDVNDYEFVTAWIKEMIRYNVISVKDHAEDIATEIIELLDSVTLLPIDPENPPADGRPNPEFLDENVESFLGKKHGYYQMINWLEGTILNDNPGVNFSDKDDYTIWEAMKPYVTAKLIKDNLINPNQKNLVSGIPGPMFAGPRRVRLWPTPISSGLTTWGCTAGGICDTKESVLNVTTGPDIDNLLSYVSVYGGQQTWFAITTNGKVRAFGKGSVPPDQDETAVGCSPEAVFGILEPPCGPDDYLTIYNGNYFDTDVGAVPLHLCVLSELAILYDEDPNKVLVDGTVTKISSKGNYAVALVNYEEGVVPGPALGHKLEDCNDTNYKKKIFSNSGWSIPNTPFNIATPFAYSCSESNSSNNYYTLKAWGRGNGGGEDAEIDYGIFYNDLRYLSDYVQPACYNTLGQDPFGLTRRDLQNKFFIWKDVACGTKHTIAITSEGALFATPTSDNTYNQSSYGYPTVSGKRVNVTDENVNQEKLVALNMVMTYYNHYPKPAYFTDNEWNTLTIKNTNLTGITYWDSLYCSRSDANNQTNVDGEAGESAIPCDIRCHLFNIGNTTLTSSNDNNPCGAPYGYSCQRAIETDRPVYTQVAAGHYHSIALSDDNNLKIWGSYLKVNDQGEPLNDENSFTSENPIPVFLPSSEIFQDTWNLGPNGGETGCGDPDPTNENIDHSKYKVYTTADKTIHRSASIFAIDGGPDYSILARNAGNDQQRLVVWGNSEMVTAVSGVTYSGLTASYGKNYYKIDKIAAGPNAIGVVYRKKNSSKRRIDIFPRPDINRGLTAGVDKNNYSDIALTNASVATIYSSGSQAQTWRAASFDTDHLKLQFKNFSDLPIYFRTQAFFRAVPGRWDFSKWFFGMPCNAITTDVPNNIVANFDPTSVYYTQTGDKNRSLSGFPQYYWMRSDWKRIQQATPLHTYEPYAYLGCGMIRDRAGRDGLLPSRDFGTGGDPNSPLATANQALNNELGACFGGDICWIGDGSPSAYAYSSRGLFPGASSPYCHCNDLLCGCPPSKRYPRILDCNGEGFVATSCFGYVNNRIGFNSNKDYFIQSSKSFGKVSDANDDNNIGKCCGVVKTNITGFFYAKRNYYYGYNEETSLYEVQTASNPYRSHYVGNSFAAPGKVYGITSSEFINELMTPKNSIPKAYNVESSMLYPYVYVGGRVLEPLKQHLSQTVIGPGCNPCTVTPSDDPCWTNRCGYPADAKVCRSTLDNLIGPGGWAHSYGNGNCIDGLNPPAGPNGFMNTSITGLLTKVLYLDTTRTDDWLGPLVSFTGYTGPFPPGMSLSCNCWCGDSSSFVAEAQKGCDCPRNLYPSGVCPNNDKSCSGCQFCCELDSNLIYQVDKEYSIDNLINYYPGTKPLPGLGDNEEPVPIGGFGRLYRISEEIYSDYSSLNCGGLTVGAPLCFIGQDGETGAGTFIAECVSFDEGPPQPIGKTSNIQCSVIEE